MRKWTKFPFQILILLLVAMTLFSCTNSAENPNQVTLDKNDPVTLVVWHYYNGQQQEAFDALVDEFNDTTGEELGIIVESFSLGSFHDLESAVLNVVDKKVGAPQLPNIFSAYADTIYQANQMGLIADLEPYLTKQEKETIVDSYLEEGRFPNEKGLKLFPFGKAVEVFILNKTDWDHFASATHSSLDSLSTLEGLVAVAKEYYEWTDSLTPDIPNDGKSFFDRDAVANYFINGMKQFGFELFSIQNGKPVLNFDKETARKLFDNYYIPYIKGYCSSSGSFRNNNIKTGNIISYIGPSSSITSFPREVIVNDTKRYPIEAIVLPCPRFEKGQKTTLQQGAGFAVNNTDDREVYASVQFLKWLAQDDSIRFANASGYLPVTKSANNFEAIQKMLGKELDPITEKALRVSIETVNNHALYAPKAFPNGIEARNVLNDAFLEVLEQDRAKVVEALDGGMPLEDAVKEYTTDSYFEAWYQNMYQKLSALVK